MFVIATWVYGCGLGVAVGVMKLGLVWLSVSSLNGSCSARRWNFDMRGGR